MGWTSGFPEIMETLSADASEMTCKRLGDPIKILLDSKGPQFLREQHFYH